MECRYFFEIRYSKLYFVWSNRVSFYRKTNCEQKRMRGRGRGQGLAGRGFKSQVYPISKICSRFCHKSYITLLGLITNFDLLETFVSK